MYISVQKYLHVLHDHQVTAAGIGSLCKDKLVRMDDSVLTHCSKLECSLSRSEIAAAFACLQLPEHWRDILIHVGPVTFLKLWRRLESIRMERRLRIAVPKYTARYDEMSADEFEHWLDAQRLNVALFEIYVTVTAEEYRYIWRRLYQAAYTPERRMLRVYVPLYLTFNLHLRKVLAYTLIHAGMPLQKIPHQLVFWTRSTLSLSRLKVMEREWRKLQSEVTKGSVSDPFFLNEVRYNAGVSQTVVTGPSIRSESYES
ncbi:hypothetical protein [Vibrio mangrovi]|uniref:Uncharacterized protein n=1 Tax=Vibrio mangrovi TaxID=474394 RepID=A0A1Y6ITS8_9VIBR|nr:hypothetical protein [Vibrio mangrovi]MDW6004735.1 hypothetical protein [Vibrio mangrovi]SMS01026.1 hypothetical protein VIM7927_02303 [Vibrio mangrovi]